MKRTNACYLATGIWVLSVGLLGCASSQHVEEKSETDTNPESEYREMLEDDDARLANSDAVEELDKFEGLQNVETGLAECVEEAGAAGGYMTFRVLVDIQKQPVALRLEDQSFQGDRRSNCVENRLRKSWREEGTEPLGWYRLPLAFFSEWHHRDDKNDWHYPEDQLGDVSEHIDLDRAGEVEQFCDPSDIQAAIGEHMGDLAPCFEEHWSRKSASRDVNVDAFIGVFRLAPSFPTYRIGLMETSIDSDEFEKCIADEVHTWTFPDPTGGVCHIYYPLFAVGDDGTTVSTISQAYIIEM